MASRHTPYDSLVLAAVVAEGQEWVGARVQKVWQPYPLVIVLSLYYGAERWLLLSAEAETARAHLVSRRPEKTVDLPAFCVTLRKCLNDGHVVFVRQRGLDRILEIGITSAEGDFQLVVELMGKHSNIMLVDSSRKVVGATKWVGRSQSRRPVLPGQLYEPPPFEPKPLLTKAAPGNDLREFEGWSPFLGRLLESGVAFADVREALLRRQFSAFLSPGHGAYPFDMNILGWESMPRVGINQALDQAYAERVGEDKLARAKASLTAQLRRVLGHREKALEELSKAREAAAQADRTQLWGELVLAYQGSIQPGARTLDAWDYQGEPVSIPLDPEKTAVENAQVFFNRAKKAKARAGEVDSQFDRISRDRDEIAAHLVQVDESVDLHGVEDLRLQADARHWLRQEQHVGPKEERPFAGYPIREMVSPAGWRVLYGTNATSNDYLTTKVARPNDWWFHVRGATSAHVVLQTENRPDRVQRPDLMFAAQVAVRNSVSKHSHYVAVDYTVMKYVRKPRGSAAGVATYVQEKTLHVEKAD